MAHSLGYNQTRTVPPHLLNTGIGGYVVKFAAVIEYMADAEKIQAIRPKHREYLAGIKAQGKLFASGPFTDGSGALII